MPEAVNVPLYLNWQFWTAVAAGLALILSQLPPIHMLLRRAKLEMELYSRIHVTHKVGNPNVSFHLILSNVGGRTIKIKGIILKIKRDGKPVMTLPAQNYFQTLTDTTPILFAGISIKPKEEWAHGVTFLNYFSRTNEKKYRDAESTLKADIFKKRKTLENKEDNAEAEKEYITPFLEMFKENFLWNPGEYQIQVSVLAVPEKAGIEKNYHFTLFESDSEELSKFQDDYKYGDGIYFNSGNHLGIFVQISEAS